MKSRAHFKSHPLHPILIVFPIAFFSGAVIFDALGIVFPNTSYHTTAHHLIMGGLISGLLAAVPGIIDFIYTIPPESSAKKRGAKHGVLNVSVILLFVCALLFHDQNIILIFFVLEVPALVLLCIAGWMGGTLVHRNQIGIDVRYAHAGKWKEETLKEQPGQMIVGTTDELKTDQMKLLRIGKKRIVLARTESGFVAFEDRCTHRGGSLAGGIMICGTVQCPWHGAQFDVVSGNVKAGPAKEKIRTYSVEVRDGNLLINIS